MLSFILFNKFISFNCQISRFLISNLKSTQFSCVLKFCVFFTGKAEQLLKQEVDLDKAGSAQFYCLHCARYFIDNQALTDHFKTKVHKRRLKALELEPYTIEDSERAAGFGNFKLPQKRKIETQTPIGATNELDEDEDVVMKDTKKQKTK